MSYDHLYYLNNLYLNKVTEQQVHYNIIEQTGDYKKNLVAGGGKDNSYFDLFGKINYICPVKNSKNRDIVI